MDPATIAILLSWAVKFSGYPAPDAMPAVQYKPHSFFVENACGGRECKVAGWYDDKNVVYIENKYRGTDSEFANSLLVHELVHYLQHHSGEYDSTSCRDSLAREREAYRVQNQFIVEALGSFRFVRPGNFSCAYDKATLAGRAEESSALDETPPGITEP